MISEALGLLLGQIAILSMTRFFKAFPKPWVHKYAHPLVRRFLRCDMPNDPLNRTQLESICVPIPSATFRRHYMRMQIIIDSINKALLKLCNYDKQLIKFEETFIGSAIILAIIFGILLTILLWLRRLSYALPNEFPPNNKGNEQKYNCSKPKETYRETSNSV
ncbi:unnamed protein product [Cercopithifilaria johnstoni]|uniref:Uncharacterized protein n=1 Tax=Cercopithifilaria johnstoni TaxID=2874296 RepID=A0A8J2M1K4_9BILA|nr:unnamed protein product [Cercopithifilaria johnstoni]